MDEMAKEELSRLAGLGLEKASEIVRSGDIPMLISSLADLNTLKGERKGTEEERRARRRCCSPSCWQGG